MMIPVQTRRGCPMDCSYCSTATIEGRGLRKRSPEAVVEWIARRRRAGFKRFMFVDNTFNIPAPYARELCRTLAKERLDISWACIIYPGVGDRDLVKVGLNYFVPNYLHQLPRLICDFMEVDVTIATVSPMDKQGYFTFGTNNDYTSTAARHCKTLIIEVNDNMPRVFGDSLLHISEVDIIVENHVPLQELKFPDAKPEDETIGKSIAELVPDGATIQLGFGGIPNAVARFLAGHKDLGIHTELFCPGMMDLIEKGVVTGKKNLSRVIIDTKALLENEMKLVR